MKRSLHQYRIGLTCDFFRFVPGQSNVSNFQNRNLAWLHELLRVPLSQLPKTTVTAVSAPEDLPGLKRKLASTEAFREYCEDPDAAWAKRYDMDDCDIFPQLMNSLKKNDLVIGFEITPTVKRFLHSNSVRYISIYIHPVRFLPDLCFGLTTNCPEIANIITKSVIDESVITSQTSRFRGLFARSRLPSCSIPLNTPILIGQTDHDAVLINKGKFVTWMDYENNLADSLDTYDTVAFIEHPSQNDNTDVIEFLRTTLKKDVISTRGNNYGIIFSNLHAPFVMTLSSSLGAEAETAGHTARYLLSDPRKKYVLPKVDVPFFGMLGHIMLDTDFWSAVRGNLHVKSVTDQKPNDFPLGDNYLRNSLDAWSYRSIQNGISNEVTIKTVFPTSSSPPGKVIQLAADCCIQDDLSNDSRQHLAALAKNVNIDLRIMEPPLTARQSINLPINKPEGKYYLHRGFHEPESWGVWSSERFSTIKVPVTTQKEKYASLRVEMALGISEGIIEDSPVLHITVGKTTMGYVLFRASSQDVQNLIFECIASPPCLEINFEITAVKSPLIYKGIPDPRNLGFKLLKITIENLGELNSLHQTENTMFNVWGISHNSVNDLLTVHGSAA